MLLFPQERIMPISAGAVVATQRVLQRVRRFGLIRRSHDVFSLDSTRVRSESTPRQTLPANASAVSNAGLLLIQIRWTRRSPGRGGVRQFYWLRTFLHNLPRVNEGRLLLSKVDLQSQPLGALNYRADRRVENSIVQA